MITHENIEEYIIDYLSDELNDSERIAVEDFLQKNPQYHEMLEGFQSVFLDKNSFSDITYTNKAALLKSSSKINFVKKLNWKYAAGIALILASATYIIVNTPSDNDTINTITNNQEETHSDRKTIQTLDKKDQQALANNTTPTKNLNNNIPTIPSKQSIHFSNHTKETNTSIEKKKSDVHLLSKLNPIQYKLEKIEPEIVVYTQFINKPSLAEQLTFEVDNEFEVAIGNKIIDVNMNKLNELKGNIDNLKDVVVKKVEDSSFDSINLWDIISK